MSKFSVCVLCPGGRRANIKVTQTTSILQIINEACTKQQLDPDHYNLKHLRHTLDSSSNIRFSNIPNNAQLELIKCVIPRDSGVVTVNLATNDGRRMMFDFSCKTSIWEILQHFQSSSDGALSIPSVGDDAEPIVIYTMQRISGDLLHSTTLQSLGIYQGKCMLRYNVQKKTHGEPEQANVSGPLKRAKPFSPPNLDLLRGAEGSSHGLGKDSEPSKRPSLDFQADVDADPQIVPAVEMQNQELCQFSIEPDILESSQLNRVPDVIADQSIVSPPDILAVSDASYPIDLLSPSTMDIRSCPDFVPEAVYMDIGNSPDFIPPGAVAVDAVSSPDFIPETVLMDTGKPPDFVSEAILVDTGAEKPGECEPEIISLGDYSSFLFSQDEARSVEFEEESEDFFELDRDEIFKLHKERSHEIQELEERPLMTRGMRDAQQSSQLLWTMRHHPVTQIRVVFPDRLIVQATFKPSDVVKSVMDFIQPMLRVPNMEFSLCTHFPKMCLNPSMSLFEAKCIPRALLYFTTTETCEPGQSWLSLETKQKKSTFAAAANAVVKTKSSATTSGFGPSTMSTASQKATSSNVIELSSAHVLNPQVIPNTTKKPKWFKL